MQDVDLPWPIFHQTKPSPTQNQLKITLCHPYSPIWAEFWPFLASPNATHSYPSPTRPDPTKHLGAHSTLPLINLNIVLQYMLGTLKFVPPDDKSFVLVRTSLPKFQHLLLMSEIVFLRPAQPFCHCQYFALTPCKTNCLLCPSSFILCTWPRFSREVCYWMCLDILPTTRNQDIWSSIHYSWTKGHQLKTGYVCVCQIPW